MLIFALGVEASNDVPDNDDAGAGDEQQPQGYVDQVMVEDDEAVDFDTRDAPGALGVGRRFYSLAYTLFHRNVAELGSETEHGVKLRWNRETVRYGTLEFDGAFAYKSIEFLSEERTGERFTLRQSDFALSSNWAMENLGGDYRGRAEPLVSSSFRFSLPSSLLRGVATRLNSNDTAVRLSFGKIGRLVGTGTQIFEKTGGTLWGGGGSRRFSRTWTGALQFWSLDDAPLTRDHQSVAAAAQYESPGPFGQLQLHTLFDSEGNWGAWFDGDTMVGRWRHRYGVFRREPGLLWTDAPISNDRQGVYWRGDRRTFRRAWSAGVDLEESNVDSNPLLPGQVLVRGFGSLNWRLNQRLNVGGQLNSLIQRPGGGLGAESTENYSITGYVNRRFSIGESRLEAEFGQTFGGVDPSDDYGIAWDQIWALPRTYGRLNTTIDWERRNARIEDTDRFNVGLSYRKEFSRKFRLFTDVQFTHLDASATGTSTATNLNLGLNWQPARFWEIDLTATWNENKLDRVAAANTTVTERRILFTVRRSFSGGAPAAVFGNRSGGLGTGTISGVLFFDENADGRQSANEEGVPGIVVFLDGRGATQTDRDGRFEIFPVATGEHMVSIALEDVPLPWGLDDEAPQTVQVSVRREEQVAFPLVRLNQ